jgi:hypothetical protein
MELNGILPVFGGGALGVALVELLKIASWRDLDIVSDKYGEWRYWACTLALVVASGIVAVLNGVEHVPLIKAVQLGINAPALAGAWATASAGQPPPVDGAGAIANQNNAPAPTLRQQAADLLAW